MRPKLIKERKGVLNTLHAWLITDNYGHELATVHAWRSSTGLWQVDVYNATEWTGSGSGSTINIALSRESVGRVAGERMYDDGHRDEACKAWDEKGVSSEKAAYYERIAGASGFILTRNGAGLRAYRAPGLEFFRLSRNFKIFQIL